MNGKEKFILGFLLKDIKILIYGASFLGSVVADTLNKAGISVYAFIDKRAGQYENYVGRKVYLPGELSTWEHKEDYAIIITIKNAYAHNAIAETFKGWGYYNIIFRPLYVLRGKYDNEVFNSIMDIHSILVDGRSYYADRIPDIRKENLNQVVELDLIKRENGFVKVYVPAQMLFMMDADIANPISYNMLVASPIVKMYEEFSSAKLDVEKEGLSRYLNNSLNTAQNAGVVIDEAWYKNWLEGKVGVYHNMCNQLEWNPLFFVNSCPRVCYAAPSMFILTSSGKNRISFQLSRGYQYIPVEMKEEDYKRWRYNAERGEDESCGGLLFAPISHPCYYGKQSVAGDYLHLWLKPIGRKIYNKVMKRFKDKLRCLDISEDGGEMSRFLKMLGLEVYRVCNEDVECYDKYFNVQIPQLASVRKSDGREGTFDILTISGWQKDKSKIIEMIQRYAKQDSVCFLLIWNNNDVLDDIISLGYKEREAFFTTIWNGEYVSGYCLQRGRNYAK